jgi:hypothetical protein
MATQSEADGHDTESTVSNPGATAVLVHEFAPAVGSVDLKIVAAPPSGPARRPPATQSEVDGHEMA